MASPSRRQESFGLTNAVVFQEQKNPDESFLQRRGMGGDEGDSAGGFGGGEGGKIDLDDG